MPDTPPKKTIPTVDVPADKPPEAPKRRRRSTTAPKTPTQAAKAAQGKTSAKSGRSPELKKSLYEFFLTVSLGVSVVNPKDAEIIRQNAEDLADAWYNLAQKHDSIKKFIDGFTTSSAWVQVIMVTGGTVLPILANHGALPPAAMFLVGGLFDNDSEENEGR